MPSKKRKYNARFPAGRIKKIMRIDDEIGKVALPVPVMISRALELFVSSLLKKSGDITVQKNARTLTLTHLKQCIYADSRLDFLKELMKNIPDVSEECNDTNFAEPPVLKRKQISKNDSDEETLPGHGAAVDENDAQPEISVVTQLLAGCACRMSADAYRRLMVVRAPSGPELVASLSSVRLLFTAWRRGRTSGSPCPTVERACHALLLDSAWIDRAVSVASGTTPGADRYASYAAACALSEAALSTVAGGPSQARLVDRLLLPAGHRAAVSVFTRVLGTDDRVVRNDLAVASSASYCRGVERSTSPPVRLGAANVCWTKTLFLDRLSERWPEFVDAAVADHGGGAVELPEVVRLWRTVFAALPSSSATACRHFDRYYTQLPRMHRLLYRTDTDPRLWLDAIRLFVAGLSSSVENGARCTLAVARDVATGFTRNRLLYFMGKINGGLERGDRARVVQETMLLALRSLRVLACTCSTEDEDEVDDNDDDQHRRQSPEMTVNDVVNCLDSYVKSAEMCGADVPFGRWLVRLLHDRDDAAVECLTCVLDIVDAVPTARPELDPFGSFVEYLTCVSFDPDVLLDFLISDENDFLPYALKILKTVCRDAEHFFRDCGDAVHDTMGLLIRLRLKILRLHENNVFPYDIAPILRLIQRCDELYSDAYSARDSS